MKQEIQDLKRRLEEATAPPAKPHKKAEEILRGFAAHSGSHLVKSHVTGRTELPVVEFDYFWDELLAQNLIARVPGHNGIYFSLSQAGRKYVMDNLSE